MSTAFVMTTNSSMTRVNSPGSPLTGPSSKLLITCKDYKRYTHGHSFLAFRLDEPLTELPLDSYPVEVVEMLCDVMDGDVDPPELDLSSTALAMLGDIHPESWSLMVRLPLRSLVKLVQLALYLDCDFLLRVAVAALKLALVTGQTMHSDRWVGLDNHLSWDAYADVADLLPGTDLLNAAKAFALRPPSDLKSDLKRFSKQQLQMFFEEAVRLRSMDAIQRLLDSGCVWTPRAARYLSKVADDVWHKYLGVVPVELLTDLNVHQRRQVLLTRRESILLVPVSTVVEERDWVSLSLMLRYNPYAKSWLDFPDLMAVGEFRYLANSIVMGQHVATQDPVLRWCARPDIDDWNTPDLRQVSWQVGYDHFVDLGASEALGSMRPEPLHLDDQIIFTCRDSDLRWYIDHDPLSETVLASAMKHGRFDDFLTRHGVAESARLLCNIDPTKLMWKYTVTQDMMCEALGSLLKRRDLEFKHIEKLLQNDAGCYFSNKATAAQLVLRFPDEMEAYDLVWSALVDHFSDRIPQSREKILVRYLAKSLPRTLTECLKQSLTNCSELKTLSRPLRRALIPVLSETLTQTLEKALTRPVLKSMEQALKQSALKRKALVRKRKALVRRKHKTS